MRQESQYTYISSATSTQVATGPGTLYAIMLGETAAGAISIIDGTSGSTANIGTLKASIVEGSYFFGSGGIRFSSGLRIVTAGASKLTVVWAQS